MLPPDVNPKFVKWTILTLTALAVLTAMIIRYAYIERPCYLPLDSKYKLVKTLDGDYGIERDGKFLGTYYDYFKREHITTFLQTLEGLSTARFVVGDSCTVKYELRKYLKDERKKLFKYQ
jgi:hypothetical protein